MPEMLDRLEAIIRDRKAHPRADSYTSKLFAEGVPKIAQKVGEEATEVIVAAFSQSKRRQIEELSDLLYHTLVLMTQLDIELDEVCAELERRHQPD